MIHSGPFFTSFFGWENLYLIAPSMRTTFLLFSLCTRFCTWDRLAGVCDSSNFLPCYTRNHLSSILIATSHTYGHGMPWMDHRVYIFVGTEVRNVLLVFSCQF
ncbi:hypothetical protein E2542_SST02701 [Spatholobus suberectus]|nr:hypothetical protein E2542_SST02701 [Spatholobus suberectus]